MSLTLTLLGTGTSAGVPMIACSCPVCTSTDPRDHRDRCAAMFEWSDKRVLIDTSPELRRQMIRHHVKRIDGVLYTHNHADHVFGIDDLRRFNAVQNQPIDLFAEPAVIDWFRRTYPYIFESHKNVNQSFVPTLIPQAVEPGEPFTVAGRSFLPLRLMHGRLPILGFRTADVAYCTDVSAIPPQTYPLLANLDILILDGLRHRHHPTHLTIQQAINIIEELKPKRAYLTHIAHDIKHSEVDPTLPEHVHLAYDGLILESDTSA